MRDILFRGKAKSEAGGYKEGEWVYGLPYSIYDGITPTAIYAADGFMVPVDTHTVTQWTGLKDKNGTKIFEGDILYGASPFSFFSQKAEYDVVEYGMFNCGCCYDVYGYHTRNNRVDFNRADKYLEVAGNIWDNPELPVPDHCMLKGVT